MPRVPDAISFTLGPYATRRESIAAIFPGAAEFLSDDGVGLVIAESIHDLANVCFTRNARSEVWSAEHSCLWSHRTTEPKCNLPALE